ncbi:hypothetical protein PM082_008609 [Marasmius tenuissimus]|nr:hypothetical protein PM082_008609 [Marasmius tenuissimus]
MALTWIVHPEIRAPWSRFSLNRVLSDFQRVDIEKIASYKVYAICQQRFKDSDRTTYELGGLRAYSRFYRSRMYAI